MRINLSACWVNQNFDLIVMVVCDRDSESVCVCVWEINKMMTLRQTFDLFILPMHAHTHTHRKHVLEIMVT